MAITGPGSMTPTPAPARAGMAKTLGVSTPYTLVPRHAHIRRIPGRPQGEGPEPHRPAPKGCPGPDALPDPGRVERSDRSPDGGAQARVQRMYGSGEAWVRGGNQPEVFEDHDRRSSDR